jgi:hypothetical protein
LQRQEVALRVARRNGHQGLPIDGGGAEEFFHGISEEKRRLVQHIDLII